MSVIDGFSQMAWATPTPPRGAPLFLTTCSPPISYLSKPRHFLDRSSSLEGTEYKAVDDLAASPRRSSEELAPERGEADAAGRELRGQRGEMRTRGAAPRCSPCHPQRVLLLRGELTFTRTLKSTDLNDPMRNEADLPALVNNTVTQSTALRGLR